MTDTPVVRFGAFADAHYAHKVYGDRHCEDSAEKLQACVDAFAEVELDFAICLGDCIDSADDVQLEIKHVRTMVDIFARYRGPKHWVLGNHDMSALTKEQFLGLCHAQAPAHYAFDVHGVHFVVLDGNCHADGSDFRAGDFSWDDAWIGARQIQWLEADLASVGDRQTVIFCHENLDQRLWQGALDPHVVRDAARVRQVLEAAGNVCAVIQAHYHPGLHTVQNGIAYVALRAMVVGAGLASNAYATLGVHADGSIQVDGVGQQPSFRVGGV